MSRVRFLLLLTAGVACACGKEGAPPPLSTAIATEAPADASDDETDGATPAAGAGRDLWFASGPGRDAILARERGDHEAAVRDLDAVLADATADDHARAGALVLRALEDLREDRFAVAADRLEQARKSPSLAPVRTRLIVWEAQARLDASDAAAALELLGELSPAATADSPWAADLLVIEADARLRSDDRAGAIAKYREYLTDHRTGARQHEVRAKLARTLGESTEPGEWKEAVSLYEQLREAVPLSDYGEEAAKALPGLRKKAKLERRGAAAAEYERRLDLADADAMLDRRRYAEAIKVADRVLRTKHLPAADACRAHYIKGSAIFKQRERAQARSAFERADRACKDAGGDFEVLRVKSRYQAARGLYAEGKYAKAARAFESLAKEHAAHSYVDDAWVLAGESWQEHGDAKAARRAYRAALAADGDMGEEAQRRLLVMLLSAGEYEEALAVCDEALAKPPAAPTALGKLHYFRGKALAALGKEAEAVTAWTTAVEVAPLEYAGLLALSRLHEVGGDAFDRALAQLRRPGDAAEIAIPEGPAAERAVLWARLGLGEEARAELGEAKVDGWPAVLVLNQAGLFAAAQRMLANLGTTWRAAPPSEAGRRRWEAAHPRPFAEIIDSGESSHDVPALLTFAIMQTESRFDPSVTSWAGAKGLVQLMPKTAEGLAREAGTKVDGDALYDPAVNLDLGMRYLGQLAARWSGGAGAVPLAAASYNAGAGSVDRWLDERGSWDLDLFIESIPYDETRRYTQSVVGRWYAYRFLYGEGAPAERIPFLPARIPSKASPKAG